MINKEITQKVIGCAMTVHNTLGAGFMEAIYQRALSIEMKLAGISFDEEKQIPIYYRNEIIGYRRVDFLIENNITLEIKAVSEIEPKHLVQGKNYLEAFNLPIGLLINFGSPSLQFKRLYNNSQFPELKKNKY